MSDETYGFNAKRVFGNGVGDKPFDPYDGGGMFDPLNLGGDFGEKIGSKAGQADGHMNFLRQVGGTSVSVPSILGGERRSRQRGKRTRQGGERRIRMGTGANQYDIRNIDVFKGFEGLGEGFERPVTRLRKTVPRDIKVIKEKNIVTQVRRTRQYEQLLKRQKREEPANIYIRQREAGIRRAEKELAERQKKKGEGGGGEEGGVKEARYGYHGIVNKPTLFLAGEGGKEYVSITPKGKKKIRQHNIFDWGNF